MKIAPYFYLSFIFILFSCSRNEPNEEKRSVAVTAAVTTDSVPQAAPTFDVNDVSVKTFEVIDSITGRSQGWGYDLYVNNARTIHQAIIPAIEGNNSFKTEADALKTGTFAADKMRSTGALPALTIEELENLGVTKK